MRKLISISLLFASLGMAQIFRVDPVPAMTVAGNVPIGGFPLLYAVAGATIKLCSDSACATPVQSWSSSAGTTLCPLLSPVVLQGSTTCQPATDPQGNFGFWLSPGTYYYTITSPGGTFGPYAITTNVATSAPPAGLYAESYGCAGNGTTDDTICMATALAAAAATGKTLYACQTYKITSGLTVTAGNWSLSGCGTGTFKLSATTGSPIFLSIGGATTSTITTVTSPVNGNFSGRALNTTTNIAVASTAGISPGTWLLLAYNATATRYFVQIAQVYSVVGSTVNFTDAIRIPMDPTESGTVTVINPISNVSVTGMTFDCSLCTGGTVNPTGLQIEYYIHSNLSGLTFQNWPAGSGTGSDTPALQGFAGYGNHYTGIRGINAGRHNGDMWWNWETNLTVSDIQSDGGLLGDSAGPGFELLTGAQISNVRSTGHTSRCARLLASAYVQFTNYSANYCEENGIFITWNTYQAQFTNVMINQSSDTSAIAIGGDDESYIWIDNFSGSGNGGPSSTADIGLFASAHHIWINGYNAGTAGTGGSNVLTTSPSPSLPNSLVNLANGSQAVASFACTGTATASTTLYLVYPSSACTNATEFSPGNYVIAPTAGVLRNLQVKAATGGVNSSSGVVTIVLLGTGNTLTCTLGTGTSCSSTNMMQIAAGAQLLVSVTTQSGETLAGLNVSFEY